jgi:deoxyhypusine synthase
MSGPISQFIGHHYRHFNAATLVDAAKSYQAHLEGDGKMLVTLAGAMSTAELGLSLAEMIRQDKVHAITCTGANLEEDIFNLVAHDQYERVPHYRDLTPADEQALLDRHMNRVTDTCIPEEEAMRRIEHAVLTLWDEAHRKSESCFPHESTLGNIFVAHCLAGDLDYGCVRSGTEYMGALADWYLQTTMIQNVCEQSSSLAETANLPKNAGPCTPTGAAIGFFQIGGGIAGDFPICVVPMIHQDLRLECPCWAYFCQISDSTTSYGSYSGAVPNEKITWGKLEEDTPKFIIESDATIVVPLIFAHVLGW